ncbi:hypothetical protein [Flavobacterium aciduliphilum]|uniref:Uncharacterized protein n=1 Tax=Flavobacterium aciduliphilum TaxID=1101402 RepID=A0A328YNW1_9FLAO|nr:hypothetical protein [Flavobacterium aciduliphilum]RAR73832.1 hypothetical protein CLV55_103151 [Flavobacterium aciduliphilum]
MSKKHFIVTFENDKAQTSETLVWAKENFPNYNEQTKEQEVYIYLVDERGFRLVSDDKKFICYKLTIFNETNNNTNEPDEDSFVKIINIGNTLATNYSIEFSIGKFLVYKLKRNTNESVSVFLIENGIEIKKGKVLDRLDFIALGLLNLDIDWIYNYKGKHLTTHIEAKKLFDYLRNNF